MWGIVLVIALLIPLVAVISDSPIGRAFAERLARDEDDASREAIGRRVALLESEIERMSRELERLEEGNEFLHRLLEERQASPGEREGR